MATRGSPSSCAATSRTEGALLRRRLALPSAALLASLIIAVLQAPTASAQPAQSPGARTAVADDAGPAWSALSPQQRSALAPLQRDWSGIDASGKSKWLEIANRFPALPASEQQRMQERMTEWSRLTPVERGRARLSFQESKQLSPSEKQARWEAYRALPEEERKALARRAQPKPGAPAASGGGGAAPQATPPAGKLAPVTRVKPVAPSIVQVGPGATTTLMTRRPAPPPHQQPGQPKIIATPGQVDQATLLPKRGPQGAPAARPAAKGPSAPASAP